MLAEFSADPNNKWAAKDAAVRTVSFFWSKGMAHIYLFTPIHVSSLFSFSLHVQIHLLMGIAIKKESSRGVSEVNNAVNVMDFFTSQILPELEDRNHNVRPVVKATSIKFVSSFRNQFTRENVVQIIPLLIHHLGSPVIVVHTFAAYAIERILFTKEDVTSAGGTTTKRPKISGAELQPFLESLFHGLFAIVDHVEWNENDYVMKCVMRSLSTAGQDVIPITQIVITKLTAALGRVAKNPRNPVRRLVVECHGSWSIFPLSPLLSLNSLEL